jgi:hypothetical protein
MLHCIIASHDANQGSELSDKIGLTVVVVLLSVQAQDPALLELREAAIEGYRAGRGPRGEPLQQCATCRVSLVVIVLQWLDIM